MGVKSKGLKKKILQNAFLCFGFISLATQKEVKKDSIEDLFGGSSTEPVSKPSTSGKSLEDLLTGGEFAPISSPTLTKTSPNILLSMDTPKYTLLKPHMGGGLSIEYSYS